MTNLKGDSADPQVPAVEGRHTANGIGVAASSDEGMAIRAFSDKGKAVAAISNTGTAIQAYSTQSVGIWAVSDKGPAIQANSEKGTAIAARSEEGVGINASNDKGIAITALSNQNTSIAAISNTGTAIMAQNYVRGPSIVAIAKEGTAVSAQSEKGIGLYGSGGQYAGYFQGIVIVTGDIQLQNADCAEDFDISPLEQVEPGTVVALNDEGTLEQSTHPYNKRVAGVISGAGDLKPGLVLGRKEGYTDKLPIALVGRVNCKVDASYGSVEVGDLLTTSATPGHAMKANDPIRSFGAVIGKALKPLKDGCGLIPILVALQ